MVFSLFTHGQELITREFFTNLSVRPGTMEAGLFRDASHEADTGGQQLGVTEPVGAIDTEPKGGSYSRATVDFGTDFTTRLRSGGDWEASLSDVEFNVSDSRETVNGLFLVARFQSSTTNDQSPQDHIFATIPLARPRLLTNESGNIAVTFASVVVDAGPPIMFETATQQG